MHPSSPELQLGEWPVLPWADWQQTAETLQLFTQIVGIVGMPTLSNGAVKKFFFHGVDFQSALAFNNSLGIGMSTTTLGSSPIATRKAPRT